MNLIRCMEAFVRVVDAQSFAGAARQLSIAKSAVAERVGQLEVHVGAKLLHRSLRCVQPTEGGSVYYQECRDLLKRLDDLAGRSRHQQTVLDGPLRIQLTSGLAVVTFARSLIAFQLRHPGIKLDLSIDDRAADLVKEGLDLSLQLVPPASVDLIEQRIASIRGVFCASPSYLEHRRALQHPDQLPHHPFATCIHYPWADDWTLYSSGEVFAQRLSAVVRSNNLQILREFALADAGVAYLPEVVVKEDLGQGALVRVLPTWHAAPLWISAVYPTSHRETRKLRMLLEHLKAHVELGGSCGASAGVSTAAYAGPVAIVHAEPVLMDTC